MQMACTRRKRWLLRSLAVAAVGFVALNVLAWNHAHAMTHFTPGRTRTAPPEELAPRRKIAVLLTGVQFPRPECRRAPAELDPECRAITIPGPDGIRLGAWYCSRGPAAPLVILFHGYGAEKTSQLGEAAAFLGMGCSVLLVDFRGSGESSEAYTTVGVCEADDVAAAVRYARERFAPPSLVLFGQSMGAAAILRAVAHSGVTPDAVILEAVFDTMLGTVRNRFRLMGVPSFPSAQLLVLWGGVQLGFNGFTHRPVDFARALTCPALFLHGADDPRARVAEARRVFAAAAGPKLFKEFPDTKHEAYVSRHPDEWRAAVAGFLQSSRSSSAAPSNRTVPHN